ncbi:MAG TPA: DEAD/DEAH box helicase [Candidatus Methanomethylophilaceae archaeon]|nr:DEAD/DEAH box helicase [Candidatus Methanomethylophilaceae archaeon]
MTSKFTDLGISEDVARAMEDMGWSEPTPIQEASVPVGLEGRDMFAQAQTGTGKTGSYGSIILGRIEPLQKVPQAIILAPTRELAVQVSEELEKLSKYTGHVCVPIYGGTSIDAQIKKLKKGVDVITGTPGRVKDLMLQKELNLSAIKVVVLDEADRMLDMGFIEDIEDILRMMPPKRQTLLMSATMPEGVKRLSYDYMNNPEEISVSTDEVVLDLTKQFYIQIGRRNKSWALGRILDTNKSKAIIFCQTKRMVDMLVERLERYEYKAEAIHGDMPQNRREKVLREFKEFREGEDDEKHSVRILVATDVAARGLDVEDITFVINYDMPDDVETYIHRIGRTGRAGKEGIAISFVTSEEVHLVKEFELRTEMVIEEMEVPDAEKGERDTIRRVVDFDQAADVFGMVKFKINLGKNDGLGKVGLSDFIVRNARILEYSIGDIEIKNEHSVVEIHKEFGIKITRDLTKAKFEGKRVTVEVLS